MTDYIRYNVLSYNSRVVTESFTVIYNHIHCLNRGLEYMGAILQTAFSNAFSELKSAVLFIQISLKFVSEDPDGNTSAIVQVRVLCQTRILAFYRTRLSPTFHVYLLKSDGKNVGCDYERHISNTFTLEFVCNEIFTWFPNETTTHHSKAYLIPAAPFTNMV